MKRMLAVLFVVSLYAAICAQDKAPDWMDGALREAKYPPGEWFTGLAEDDVRPGTSRAAALQRVEKTARGNLAENILIHITSASRNETSSIRVTSGAQSNEVVNENYGEIIETSTNADVAKSKVESYQDQKSGRIYAFARVKMSDLASYYDLRIEQNLQRAKSAVDEARQSILQGKPRDALKTLAAGKDNLGECPQYLRLLSGIDYGGGNVKRMLDREAALSQEISAVFAEAEGLMSFYISGTETIDGMEVNRLIKNLKSILSKNGYRFADNPTRAGYILRVEAEGCKVKTPPDDDVFCYACVSVKVENVKAKTSDSFNFEGYKNGNSCKGNGKDIKEACLNAFDKTMDTLWKKMRADMEIFR